MYHLKRPTQPPTLSGMENKYQPMGSDGLWLGEKGDMVCVWWQVKLSDPL